MTTRLLSTLSLLILAGCTAPVDEPVAVSDPEVSAPAPSAPRSETSIRFKLGGSLQWGDVPFPSDRYRDADGGILVPRPPTAISDAVWSATEAELAHRSGFCTTCNITFVVDGSLDVASVDGAIRVVDVDESSSHIGESIPVVAQYDAESGHLAVRPVRGRALRPNTTYAAVVTDTLLGGDGLPLTVPDALAESMQASAVVARLGSRGGPTADEIVGLTVFTTDRPASLLSQVRDLTVSAPTSVAAVDRVWDGDGVDELLGETESTSAGYALPASEGAGVAIRHQTTRFVVSGSFDAPRFLDGASDEVGVLARDGSSPRLAGVHDVPFVLVIPEGADLGSLGVLVVHHGFSDSRAFGFALADTAGRAGLAVLAIDAYQHGARAKSTRDSVNEMRGTEGPDGFVETTKLDVTARVFGFSGVPADERLSPVFALSAFVQFVADAISTLRFVRDGDVSAIRDAAPDLAGLRFDPDRMFYMGNSMGSVIGAALAAVEPLLDAAVLTVMPGSIIETLAESGEFRPLSERLFLPLLGVEREFDEVDSQMLFDPTVDLFRWVMEPVDGLALSSGLETSRADILIQLAGHDEIAAPTASHSVVEAARLGASVYEGAGHNMIHSRTDKSKYEAPLELPLTVRDSTITVDNPTDAVHDEIEQFFRAKMESDTR